MTLTASDLLDTYADLIRRLRWPSPMMEGYLAFHMSRELAGNRKAGQFYPVVPRTADVTGPEATAFARHLGGSLTGVPVYQVTADMCQVIEAMFEATVAAGPTIIYQALLPAPAGFCWLDRPFHLQVDGPGPPEPVQALSWSVTSVLHAAGRTTGLRFCLWQSAADARHEDFTAADPELIAQIREDLGALTLLHSDLYLLDGPMPFLEKGCTSSVMALAVYLNMLLTMLGMDLAAVDRAEGTRGARRRAERSAGKIDVLVVTLRRRPHQARPGGNREVEWSRRWLVQAHYRHRSAPPRESWHHAAPVPGTSRCVSCSTSVSYIPPYIKGPEDAPMEPRRRLHRLAR